MELIGDLPANSFLNAHKRFTARRGICRHLYSDNATNFNGANNKLKQTINSLTRDDENFQAYLNENKISWHFIPSRSPHPGGLWEAAIKSAKFHMKRVIGKVILNYDEFFTVIAQIEAVLNSRPLAPLTNDPKDFIALSPSHFLIGDYLTAIPEEEVQAPLNRVRTMVMLRDHLPPLLWKIDRVIVSDGLVRVVSVRTTNGVVKRDVQKICVLPIESE
ncbi:hypothetical protein Trydic_g6703 [Trypoxylus dichotomus]